jgi:(1->4)-alpha-D-glucan 1-alpha-D-glucosylmutase
MFEYVHDQANFSHPLAMGDLLETPEDGRLKLYLIWKTLCLRTQQPDVFQQGEYLPVEVQGAKANHVVTLIRRYESTSVLVVAPRLAAALLNNVDIAPVGSRVWEDTRITLPTYAGQNKCRNVLTGKTLDAAAEIRVSEALAELPVALCVLG